MKTKNTFLGLVLSSAFLAAGVANAQVCKEWDKPQVLGYIDSALLREESGVAFSKNGKNLFHIRDGRVTDLFATDMSGGQLKRIPISDFAGKDVEELFSAHIGEKNFLILADIGDNKGRRDYLRLAIIDESAANRSLENSPVESVEGMDIHPDVSSKTVYFGYPDGAKNSEAMAFHPNGDLFLISKSSEKGSVRSAKVYRLAKEQWNTLPSSPNKLQVMEYIGELEIPKINSDAPDGFGKIVTGMDISSDGKTLVVLTYFNAIEFDLDLSKYSERKEIPKFGVVGHKVTFQRLTQQESIRYYPDDSGILISTEFDAELGARANALDADKSPMLSIKCLKK